MSKRLWLVLPLVLIWLTTSACACGDLARWAADRAAAPETPPAEAPALDAPRPTPEALPKLPTTPDTAFRLTLTETQLNQHLEGLRWDEAGLRLEDAHATLSPQGIAIALRATQPDTGISTGISLRATPLVADDMLYLRVEQVELDGTLSGLARRAAQAAIEEALKQVSFEEGIPVPLEGVVVEEVILGQGEITLVGRTR